MFAKKRLLRTILATWLGAGAASLVVVTSMTGCAPIEDSGGAPNYRLAEPLEDRDSRRLEDALNLWQQESGEFGDPFTAGRAAYDIGSIAQDPRWARTGRRKLAEARKSAPDFALATAYLGSSHAIIARDFPIQGLWQVFPGPGFVRMYHVFRAESLLNKAVDQAPDDPVVRLVRAATVSQMPGLLVNHATAAEDFALLERWASTPSLNPDYADVLRSPGWIGPYRGALEAARSDSAFAKLLQ